LEEVAADPKSESGRSHQEVRMFAESDRVSPLARPEAGVILAELL